MTYLRFVWRSALALQLSLLSGCGEDHPPAPRVDGGLDLGASATLDGNVLAADVPASSDGPTSAVDLAADLPLAAADVPIVSGDVPLASEAGIESETGTSDLGSTSDCLHIEGGPDLGEVAPGGMGTEVIFKVWSSCDPIDTGPLTVTIDHPYVTISTNTCATATRPTLASPCTVGLRLTPPATASFSAITAVLTVRSSVGSASATVTGRRAQEGAYTDPSTITFGAVPIGEAPVRTVTLSNFSNEVSPPVSTSLRGTGAAQLSILETTTCKGPIPPATSCQIVVQYRPTDLTGVSATVVVTVGTEALVAVPVVGIAIPAVTPSTVYVATPAALDFGVVPIGQSSTLTTTLTNTSATTSLPFGVYLYGAGTAQVSLVGTTSCGPLAPAASCRITVRYAPEDTSGVDALIIVTNGSISIGIPMVGAVVIPSTSDASVEAGQDVGGG